MNVWYAIPSARDPDEAMQTLAKWRERGYKVAVMRDLGAAKLPVDLCLRDHYFGYANAVNALCRQIMREDSDAEWIVTGGDDLLPDEKNDAGKIARECSEHFGGTLGIMQPTGDRHMIDEHGTCAAERVCISPWLGREWCRRGYGGNGPLWHEYFHLYVDEDLHNVAKGLGLLWHRPELCQYHAMYNRIGKKMPAFLSGERMAQPKAQALFCARRAAGYPGSELSPP